MSLQSQAGYSGPAEIARVAHAICPNPNLVQPTGRIGKIR